MAGEKELNASPEAETMSEPDGVLLTKGCYGCLSQKVHMCFTAQVQNALTAKPQPGQQFCPPAVW